MSASAKTLAECFTSGSTRPYDVITQDSYKTAWGQTTRYGSSHYLRAYLGGQMYNDTGRVWATDYNNFYVETAQCWIGNGLSGRLTPGPTAYCKYGY